MLSLRLANGPVRFEDKAYRPDCTDRSIVQNVVSSRPQSRPYRTIIYGTVWSTVQRDCSSHFLCMVLLYNPNSRPLGRNHAQLLNQPALHLRRTTQNCLLEQSCLSLIGKKPLMLWRSRRAIIEPLNNKPSF